MVATATPKRRNSRRLNDLSQPERDALVISADKICRALAGTNHAYPSYPRDDALSDAYAAAVVAATTWQPDGGAAYLTYAHSYINRRLRGYRIDAVRRAESAPAGSAEVDLELVAIGDSCDVLCRVAKAEAVDSPEQVGAEITTALLTEIRRQLFAAELAALPPAMVEMVEMVVSDGLTVSQIAARRGCRQGVVRMTLANAVRRIQGATSGVVEPRPEVAARAANRAANRAARQARAKLAKQRKLAEARAVTATN